MYVNILFLQVKSNIDLGLEFDFKAITIYTHPKHLYMIFVKDFIA